MHFVIKLILVCVVCLIAMGVLYIAIVIGYSTLTAFKPGQEEKLPVDHRGNKMIIPGDEISLMTWNIGYAGLGKEMDFFYEGGKQVRPSPELNTKYLEGIISHIRSDTAVNLILIQEADFHSKRSFYINQHLRIAEVLTGLSSTFAVNYKAGYVPVPLTLPMGRVHSGLSIFSEFNLPEADRISAPGRHAWPKRLFMPNRCFLKARFPTGTGKDLIVWNIHNSAFGDEADLRAAELSHLRNLATEAYTNGNYVIVGGDWNQNPPGMDPEKIRDYIPKEIWPVERDYFPEGWTWAFDPFIPTNRDVDQPFDPEKTTCTIIDYFLVSPNIDVIEVKTTDLQFEHSDHHPVTLRIILRAE
jgi:endonuclease/exonuclease/phosphatase family metal-dependent hydrolase